MNFKSKGILVVEASFLSVSRIHHWVNARRANLARAVPREVMAEPGKKTKDYSQETKTAISEAWDAGKVHATREIRASLVTN